MTEQITCMACQGGGVQPGLTFVRGGALLPLCERCDGAGVLADLQAPDRPYRAAWCVGRRYVVRLAVPRRTGGTVEMSVEWAPRVPPATGQGRLRPDERRQYELGRDTALRALREQMGGGDWSIIAPEPRQ